MPDAFVAVMESCFTGIGSDFLKLAAIALGSVATILGVTIGSRLIIKYFRSSVS